MKSFTRYFSSLKEAENQLFAWGYQLDRQQTNANEFVYNKTDDTESKQAIVTSSPKGYKCKITTTENSQS